MQPVRLIYSIPDLSVKGIPMKDKILAEALKLCAKKGIQNVQRIDLAQACNCATGTITYHMGETSKLRATIIRHAIEVKDLTVIAQAYTARHPLAMKVPPELIKTALHHLARQA